jgi:hypothetical protein
VPLELLSRKGSRVTTTLPSLDELDLGNGAEADEDFSLANGTPVYGNADEDGFADYRDLTGAAENARAKRKIVCELGKMPQMVDAAAGVLRKNAIPLKLFQRTNEARVVKITALDKDQPDKKPGFLLRPRGPVMLITPSAIALQDHLERHAHWVKFIYKKEGKTEITIDCPPRVAVTYMARTCEWDLPELIGTVEAPIMRPDGSILNRPGYDPATGLFFYTDVAWPLVPKSPTPANAVAAARTLLRPFAQFPFVTESARAVYLAEIMTANQRRLLRSAPLFGHSAPTPRSGKSLLAQGTGIIAVGHAPASSAASKEFEEFRKLITSVLREGHPITNLDNIDFPLKSADLCRAITEELYEDRVASET